MQHRVQRGRRRTVLRRKGCGVMEEAIETKQAPWDDGGSKDANTMAEEETEDLDMKAAKVGVHVDIIVEGTNEDVPGVMMIEGVSGGKGISERKGLELTMGAKEVEGPKSGGYHMVDGGAANEDSGQEKKVKGAAMKLGSPRGRMRPRGSERA